jgi:kynurenine formamidase
VRGEPLRDGVAIGPRDLAQAAERAGVAIGNGDIVLIRTGWAEHQGRADSVDFDGEPGLDVDAALWLAERGIAALGADNFAVEVMPFAQGEVFPVHQRLIRDFGVPLLEGLLLHELATAGRHEFLFVASPLPIAGGTGSPINPIAIL